MERPDLFRELIGGGYDSFPGMGDRPLHSDPMHSFFGPSPSFLPSSPSPMSLSPSPLLYEQMQRMTADSHFGSMKHDRFTFPTPSFPPTSTFPSPSSTTSTLPSPLPPTSSTASFDLKALQTHAQESEELQRNLEYHVQMNQLKHLHKLLNFQASMSYIQAMKIAAAADQTQALLNTLDLAIRSGSGPTGPGGSPTNKKFPRSTLVQDHILNVSKQLELISQHSIMGTGSLPFGGPLPTGNPFLGDVDPFAHHPFPPTRSKLEQDLKKLREVSGLHSDQSLEQQLQLQQHQHQHTQQLLLEQRQQQKDLLVKTPSSPHQDQLSTASLIPGTPSNGPSPFRGSSHSLPLSREYLKKEEPTALTPTTPLTPMLGSPPVSPSSLSSLSHSDPPTPTPEEKYHQKRRSELIADNNKQQKGEKGLFYCEDPACGAELRTRSGFRRHRQKHASGHVLRKRARKSPSGDLDLPLKNLATPATVVSQRHPLAQSLHNLARPHTPLSTTSATPFDPFPPTTDLLF